MTRMRTAFAYSNLKEPMKSYWNEYKRLRPQWQLLEEQVKSIGPKKPHFAWDKVEKRFRPVAKLTWEDELRRKCFKANRRMIELAYFMYELGYIAPDFISHDFEKNPMVLEA